MTETPKRTSHADTLADRFVVLIETEVRTYRRWAWLEERSSIAASSWQRACSRKQRPTAEMIEAVGRLWPNRAFWLVTGEIDRLAIRAVDALEKLQKLDFKIRADGQPGLPAEACRIIQSAIPSDKELPDG